MKEILTKIPKTSVAAACGAVLTYCLGKGYIGPDEANLISALLLVLGISANVVTRR